MRHYSTLNCLSLSLLVVLTGLNCGLDTDSGVVDGSANGEHQTKQTQYAVCTKHVPSCRVQYTPLAGAVEQSQLFYWSSDKSKLIIKNSPRKK